MSEPRSLPDYEELIDNLANRLEGLSVVHRGVGEATTSLVAAHRELASLQQKLQALLIATQHTQREIERLEPAHLESSLDRHFGALSSSFQVTLEAIASHLAEMEEEATDQREKVKDWFELLLEDTQLQKPRIQQISKLTSSIVEGSTPYQKHTTEELGRLQAATGRSVEHLQAIILTLDTYVSEFDRKLNETLLAQEALALAVDELRSTSSNILALSKDIISTTSAKIESLREDVSAETKKLSIMQAVAIILCIAVLISVWATA